MNKLRYAMTSIRPKQVSEYIVLPSAMGDSLYYLCPRCKILLPRERMRFCDSCGQQLGWITHLHCHQKNTHSAP